MELTVLDVQKHLDDVGYSKGTQERIRYYLLGRGFIGNVDEIALTDTGGLHTFADFYSWFEDEYSDPLEQTVVFTNDEGDEVVVTIGSLIETLVQYGYMVIEANGYLASKIGTTYDRDGEIKVHIVGESVETEEKVEVLAEPKEVAQALRIIGYEVVEP
jgi:hypothetical protein